MKEDRNYKLRESIAPQYCAIFLEGTLVVRSGDAFGGLLLLFSGMVIGEWWRVNKTSTKEVASGRLRKGLRILFFASIFIIEQS